MTVLGLDCAGKTAGVAVCQDDSLFMKAACARGSLTAKPCCAFAKRRFAPAASVCRNCPFLP